MDKQTEYDKFWMYDPVGVPKYKPPRCPGCGAHSDIFACWCEPGMNSISSGYVLEEK